MTLSRGSRPTRAEPLPPHPGNTYLPFASLVALEKINNATYRSVAPAYAPGGPVGVGRSYGAHVYMQAAWAASQTVSPGFELHSVSGNFLLSGELNTPFVYEVQITRTGRSYCTRTVNVTQSEGKGICFTCICSFKTPEHEQVDTQHSLTLYEHYASVLHGRPPSTFPEVPGMDLPFYHQRRLETGLNDEFPGLECRRVDMAIYNRDRHPLDRRQLIFYRTIGDLPQDPNMHLAAHLYATDRNSLYIVANHFELGDYFTSMSSLVHTVTFHSPFASLRFGPGSGGTSPMDDPKDNWFCLEAWGSRMSGGRATFHCRLWNSDGEHIATGMQDGLIRYLQDPTKPTSEELKVMEATTNRWKGKDRSVKL